MATYSPSTSNFIFSSSYLPCWRNRDQEDGLLLSELCIAHRGSKDSRAIFGYLVGTIFVGFLTLRGSSFHHLHCYMQCFEEEFDCVDCRVHKVVDESAVHYVVS